MMADQIVPAVIGIVSNTRGRGGDSQQAAQIIIIIIGGLFILVSFGFKLSDVVIGVAGCEQLRGA